MSTIGITSSGNTLTVNGKTARAVNSVSGSVSNNNLRINVNGVSSGDIPLPESKTSEIIALNNIYQSVIDIRLSDFTPAISGSGAQTIVGNVRRGYATHYICGTYYNSVVMCNSGEYDLRISDMSSLRYDLQDDLYVHISIPSFDINIEDGDYKMPIDSLYESLVDLDCIRRKVVSDFTDDECIFFTVNSRKASITSEVDMTLPGSKFLANDDYPAINIIEILADRIIKIE